MRVESRRRGTERAAEGGAEQVVAYVRGLIERKRLRPGDRLPAERDLAAQIGLSRPTVRMGLHALAAMGCVRARHGSGTYIPGGPPALATAPLSLLASLHDFTLDEMFDARRIFEVGAAGLAAEVATPDQVASLAEEVASLFAAMGDGQRFLVHDVEFHRAVAAASGNPIVAAVVDMVAALYYERRRATAEQASLVDMRDAAGSHREIYLAIRARDGDAARRAMNDHLTRAHAYQEQERRKPRPRRAGAR